MNKTLAIVAEDGSNLAKMRVSCLKCYYGKSFRVVDHTYMRGRMKKTLAVVVGGRK